MDPDLNVHEIAYLCGGPARVAMVALAALHQDGQIKITPGRHRVTVVRPEPRDEIESAALGAIPRTGVLLGRAVTTLSAHEAVTAIRAALSSKGLSSPTRLPVGRAARSRRLRRTLADGAADQDEPTRIAVLGSPGIADVTLRRIFETPDPEPVKPMKPQRFRDPSSSSCGTICSSVGG